LGPHVIFYCTMKLILSLILLQIGIITLETSGLTIRLDSGKKHIVTFNEVDDIARMQNGKVFQTLTDWYTLWGGRSVVYPQMQLLAFIDEPKGLSRRAPLVLSFQQYFQLRSAAQLKKLWRVAVLSYVFETKMVSTQEGLLRLDLPVNLPTFLGGGTPVIRIIGNQKIEMDMASEWEEGSTSTATNRVTRAPNVAMKQTQEFTVTGNIGEKIEVNIKQNSEAFTDLDNNLSIRYQDVSDDGIEGNGILKSIEAGNVSLELKNTEFTGYTQQHNGLFGIKMKSQLGNFHLTAIASQEKGEGQSASFQAGSKGTRRLIRDIDFKRRTYYFIDERYRQSFSVRDENGYRVAPEDSVRLIQVYVSGRLTMTNQAKLVNASAYLDPPVYDSDGVMIQGSDAGEFVEGKFKYLESDEFYVNQKFGYIVLDAPLQEDDILAVYYETENQDGEIKTIGRLDSDVPKLRLLKRQQELIPEILDNPSQWGTWQYEWRNVYSLGQTDIEPDNFELKIYRLRSEGEHAEINENGTPYIQLLGLDRRGLDPGSEPDRLVDIDYALIDFKRGELIFPDQYPFAPNLTKSSAGQLAYPETQGEGIADESLEFYTLTSNLINSQFSTLHKYYLEVEYQDQLSQYSLGRSNIIEGSEIVRLNGQQLQRGSDYIILYEVGQIRFTNEAALSPDAEVTVQFQFAPFFKPVSNTLLGLQGEYQFNQESWLKGTLLYRSDKSLEQKSRIGRETGRYLMWGIDTRLVFNPNFLTSFMDFIAPADLSKTESSLRIEGEISQSIPNPNILGDGFIDDFEGSKVETDLGVRRSGWRPASPPENQTHLQRGKLVWYNPIEQVDVRQIYPTREVTGRDQLQHVLVMDFDPNEPDLRWGGISADSTFNSPWIPYGTNDILNRWAGLMHPLARGDVDQTRSRFVEVWINGNRGKLHMDFGVISEDLNEDGKLDTEDDRSDGFGNNLLEPEEDIGIDGLKDEDEFGYDPISNPDPHGDNFTFEGTIDGSVPIDQIDYSKINGPEANATDPDRNRRPDTEDLDNSGYLEKQNDYFSFAINLSPGHEDTLLVAGGDRNQNNWGDLDSWRLYRIPLNTDLLENILEADSGNSQGFESPGMSGSESTGLAYEGVVGIPNLALIETVRIWVTKVEEPVKIRIAGINIVGNQWQEEFSGAITDSIGNPIPASDLANFDEKFDVAVKNTHDNPDEYTSPPGAIIEYDRVTGLQNKEQSLILNYTNLQPYHSAQAYRTLFSDQDYTLYNALRLYIHGSDNFNIEKSPEFYIRFGSGKYDYYEYRTSVSPGWSEENHLRIIFNDLTILKSETEIARQTTIDTTSTIILSDGREHSVRFKSGPPGEGLNLAIVDLEGNKQIRVLGSPALARIRHITVGIYNPYDEILVGGELWLNELRAADVRRDRGLAGRLKVNADLADVFSIFGTIRSVDSHFRRIGGDEAGTTSTVTNLSTLLNLGKMLPKDWGLSIPLRFRWKNDLRLPRLQVGSDIVLMTRAKQEEQRTENTDHSFTASFSKRVGSKNHLIAWTLERLRLDFTSTSYFRHSVSRIDTSGSYRARMHYDLTPRSKVQWPILRWTGLPQFFSGMIFNPLPVRLELTSEINRRKQTYQNRLNQQIVSDETSNDQAASFDRGERFTRYINRNIRTVIEPFKSVRMNYNLSIANDMKVDSTITLTKLKFGPEISYRQNLGVDYRPEITTWFRPSYNFTTTYSENRNPLLQLAGGSPDSRSIMFSNQQGIRTSINMVRMVSKVLNGSSTSGQNSSGWFRRNIVERFASVFRMFTPVTLNYSVSRNRNLFNAISRPSFKERLGLNYFAVPFDTLASGGGVTGIQRNQENENYRTAFNIGTGLRILGATLSVRPTWISTQNQATNLNRVQNNITWPEMSLRWSPNPQKMGNVGRIFRRIEISSAYSRRKGRTSDLRLLDLQVGQGSSSSNITDSYETGVTRTTTTTLSPLVGVIFDLNAGLVVRGNYTTINGLTRFGSNATDQKQRNRSLTIALDYRLRSGIRIFGKRTNGDINARLQFSRNTSRMLISRLDTGFQANNGQNQNRFSATTDYRFSRYIRGGLTVELTNTLNVITRQKRVRRGGGLWTEFLFN